MTSSRNGGSVGRFVSPREACLRQRYDPTDPDGTMGLASSRRSGGGALPGGLAPQPRSSRSSSTRSHASRAKSPSGGGGVGGGGGGGSGIGDKGRGSGGGGGEGSDGGYAEDSDEEEEEEEESDEEGEEPDPLVHFGAGSKKADLSLFLPRSGPMSDVCVVIDSGFSFTHILPFYQGRALHKSVRRFTRAW